MVAPRVPPSGRAQPFASPVCVGSSAPWPGQEQPAPLLTPGLIATR